MSIELINNRIASFTPEYRDFVMSDFSDAIAAKIASEENLDEDIETAIANMIFLYTILVISDYELTEALAADCGLGLQDALRITKTILNALPKDMLEAQQAAYAALMQSENPIDEQTRRTIIATQPERQKLVYFYAKTNPHLRVLLEQFALPEDQIAAGLMLLGDVILGFYKTEDTVPLLQQELGLDPKTAALLGAEVLEFFNEVTDPNWQPPESTPRSNTLAPETNRIPLKSPALFNVAETPAPTPATTTAVPNAPVAAPEPVYTPAPVGYSTPTSTPSYQSAAPAAPSLDPTPTPLSSIPSYTPPPNPAPAPAPAPDRPRWSTDI